jgi:hypothetical protein
MEISRVGKELPCGRIIDSGYGNGYLESEMGIFSPWGERGCLGLAGRFEERVFLYTGLRKHIQIEEIFLFDEEPLERNLGL